ncbi:RagB/SusD family nutrient uptake outer membrane protein [Geofilum sp. OHC36d9]|uniref:RagB/SusD family nutrient uptake outer membrane protein n=1 Tax=Geofilum sp. OHC36d9 TaxID=3458413 RepID=UPI004034AC64
MKRNFNIKVVFIALIMSVVSTSCEDWLFLEPDDGIIVEDFWQSEKDLKSATMGIYASMLGNNVSGGYSVPELMLLWGEIRADMITYYNTLVNDYMMIYQGDLRSDNGFAKWNSIYRTINYCNQVLENAANVEAIDGALSVDKMNQYRAEALTIRAMMYLLLNKTYREVPLVTTATTSDDQVVKAVKVQNQSELWDQIEADLKEAEKYAVTTYGTTDAEDKGRVTIYTIWSIMADFYLWRDQAGDAQLAEQACENIISSNKFSLVIADDNWLYNLYHKGNSIEGIFELQFDQDILNPFYSLFNETQAYRANPDVMEAFFPIDELLPSVDSADVRADRGSYRSSRSYSLWKYIGLSKNIEKASSQATSNFIVYRYADILLMKAEALALQINGSDATADALRADEANSLITRIRSRARASEQTYQGAPSSRDGLLNYILEERAREFAFEGKRWFDLLRFAKRDNYAKKSLLKDMLIMSAPATRLLSIQAKMEDENYHYMPIPQDDIDAAYPLLIQNPFYVTE